jgi:hypothetical protein
MNRNAGPALPEYAVSDKEAQGWGIRASVVLEYIALSDIEVYLVTADRIALPITEKLLLSAFTKADGSDWPLQDVLSRVARMLPDSGVREGRIVISIGDVLELFLGSVPVKELLLEFNWHRVRREQILPILFNYTSASDMPESIGMAEASGHSRTAIVYSDNAVSSIVDVSVNSFSPCSFLSKIQVEFGREVRLRACGVIGLEKLNTSDFAICVFHAIPKHSRKYRQLKQATLAPGTSRRMSWNHPEASI